MIIKNLSHDEGLLYAAAADMTKESLKGTVPESWLCVDCGRDMAPGMFNRVEMVRALAAAEAAGRRASIYGSTTLRVSNKVWKAAGMKPKGGCLCIGCIEKRLDRKLTPKDFHPRYPFNHPDMPATRRLKRRRRG